MPSAFFPHFDPHPWLPGGHLQTLAGHLFGSPPAPATAEVVPVRLADGDELHLHLDKPSTGVAGAAERPIVILLHGLGGCSESTYNLRISSHLTARGYEVVRFNHRGCAPDAAHLSRGIYHAARLDDLDTTLKEVMRARPERPLLVVAFSLSANLLLRYLASGPDVASLEAAMAVCPPVDLELCSLTLARRRNKYMDVYYTRRLLGTVRQREALFPDLPPVRLPAAMNLRLFDELYTARLGGFRNRSHYYETASAKPHLHRIEVPTLILAAADDPIIPPESFADARFGANCVFRNEKSGGHMGFISKAPTKLGDRRWMDMAVVDWVEAHTAELSRRVEKRA